jgi:hypothetical protein
VGVVGNSRADIDRLGLVFLAVDLSLEFAMPRPSINLEQWKQHIIVLTPCQGIGRRTRVVIQSMEEKAAYVYTRGQGPWQGCLAEPLQLVPIPCLTDTGVFVTFLFRTFAK